MDPLVILSALERKLNELAHGAFQRPAGKTEYDFGMAVGSYQGVLQSINEVKRLMQDRDDDQ